MNITGEQIKEGRERLHLTQQELATQVGVSMRTVGNWERGESVPRSRMGAIRQALNLEEVNDSRSELGRLINEELEDSGRGPVQIVGAWSPSAKRLFYWWKDGTSAPSRKYRAMLEDALGWRRGVVTDILDAPITHTFTLSEVRDWSAQPKPGLAKARDLTVDELLMELTRKVGLMESELEELRGPSNVVPLTQDMFDVAAHGTSAGRNMEHLEDDSEGDD